MVGGMRPRSSVEQREHRLDRARRRQRVPDHRFVRGHRNALGALAEYGHHADTFHLVVLGRAGAVRVDVVDVVGREACIGDGVADAADDRLAVRARAGAVERIRHLAAALDHTEDFRAARDGVVQAFEHERAGAFRHDEAIAVLRERLCRRLRRIVRRRRTRRAARSGSKIPD